LAAAKGIVAGFRALLATIPAFLAIPAAVAAVGVAAVKVKNYLHTASAQGLTWAQSIETAHMRAQDLLKTANEFRGGGGIADHINEAFGQGPADAANAALDDVEAHYLAIGALTDKQIAKTKTLTNGIGRGALGGPQTTVDREAEAKLIDRTTLALQRQAEALGKVQDKQAGVTKNSRDLNQSLQAATSLWGGIPAAILNADGATMNFGATLGAIKDKWNATAQSMGAH